MKMRTFLTFILMFCATYMASAANHLTFTAEEDSSTFCIKRFGDNNPSVQYSLDDGETWATLSEDKAVVLAHKGDKALLRGNNPKGFSTHYEKYTKFTMGGKIAASGSVMSLIDNIGEVTTIPNDICFWRLFEKCESLTKAPELPATTLKEQCYVQMFDSCTNLIQAPELPANTMKFECYAYMFSGCASLTEAPELPAEYLDRSCYGGMFGECTSLTKAPELPATTLDKLCYGRMFENCTSLTQAPELPSIYLADSCYMRMFAGCTSLTKAPELPATEMNASCYQSMFSGCSALTQAPELPATTLSDNCYRSMFSECSSLATAPELPATTLSENCYQKMFSECAALTQAPELPATIMSEYCYADMFYNCTNLTQAPKTLGVTLASNCYRSMFSGCSALTQTPELPATKLANACYEGMFYNCSKLVQAPELPATTLADSCYKFMFRGCINLTQAPELPAKKLAKQCYAYMFNGCLSLKQAPELPARFLVEGCYNSMFDACKFLSEITVSITDWGVEYEDSTSGTLWNTSEWVKDVASTGTFYCPQSLPLEYGIDRIPEGWTIKPTTEEVTEPNYLTFTAEEDSSSFGIKNVSNNNTPNILYSVDNGKNWKRLKEGETITLGHKGDKALLRGDNPTGLSSGTNSYTKFVMSGKIAASGSVMSLIDITGEATAISQKGCFSYLFSECESLTQSPELPAKKLSEECYAYMFNNCTSLTKAPKLPAYTMEKLCYKYMFNGCTNLKEAPELPSTELEKSCYEGMFYNCTRLAQAPELPATTLSQNCYQSMFSGCKSLTQAPELPAEKLERECYYSMFEGCDSLSSIKVHITDWGEEHISYSSSIWNTSDWVKGVAPTGTFYCSNLLRTEYGPNRIPRGWKVEYYDGERIVANYLTFKAKDYDASIRIINYGDNDPKIEYSHNGGISWTKVTNGRIPISLNDPTVMVRGNNPEGFSTKGETRFMINGEVEASGSIMSLIDSIGYTTKIPNKKCFMNLFLDCTGLTVAPELPATSLTDSCYYAMFSGCTSLTQTPELPADSLAENCYNEMFKGCTSLTEVKCLSTQPLVKNCYANMFEGCSNLSIVSVSFHQWGDETVDWLKDVAPKGTFFGPEDLPEEYGDSRIPQNWRRKNTNYLTFTAEEDASSFGIDLSSTYDNDIPDIKYSLDNGKTWSTLKYGKEVVLNKKGDKALLRGYNPNGFSFNDQHYYNFTMSGKIAASGSVMSLLDGVGFSTEITKIYCFTRLFKQCESLTQAPELPATTLAEDCYSYMFSQCTNLIQAPELPAKILEEYCYSGIFSGCTNLTQAPELPAKILASGCYASMFYNCTNLTKAPELPAKIMKDFCYSEMFYNCTNLTKAPELPARVLERGCYYQMFVKCKKLSEIKVGFTQWGSIQWGVGTTYAWVASVAPTGTFICRQPLPLEYGIDRIPEGWRVIEWEDCPTMLSFTAEEDSSSFKIKNTQNDPDIQYSLDGGETWIKLQDDESVILEHTGDKALLRGDNPNGFSTSVKSYTKFYMKGKIAANGSIMNLLCYSNETLNIPNKYCFYKLFEGCTSLTHAPELPAITLDTACYASMFAYCKGLTQAPNLPAITLCNTCYESMFSECSSLSQAPELPASTLGTECYELMFNKCTSLTHAPELFATTLARSCYLGMFNGCTSLTHAPELPATTLEESCYRSMFSGCTSLTQAPELQAMALSFYCYERMFAGCTSLTKAPELPATDLSLRCYRSMFEGCTNLSEIRVAFDSWSSGSATESWVNDVAPTGKFICPKSLEIEFGEDRIPEGWIVVDIEEVGVGTTTSDGIAVWSEGHTIYIRNAEGEVSLYDPSGRLISVSTGTADETRSLYVPCQGIYFVRANGKTLTTTVR